MKYKLIPFFMSFLVLFVSCGCSDSGVSVKGILVGNTNPPILLKVDSLDEKTIRLIFDKPVFVCDDSMAEFNPFSDGFGIVLNLNDSLKPGECSVVSGRVCDEDGNTTGFSTPVWGFNPNLAEMVINEFVTKDEAKTEIMVVSDGNTAGAVLYNGVPESFDGMAYLPNIDVKKGDFIVVWWTGNVVNPYGNDVVADKTLKGYSNNGIQTLAVSPAEGANVMDCVVYSNFSSTFEGYGSKDTLVRVEIACQKGWWNDKKKPINSVSSTKTRSISRIRSHEDSNSCDDWYITKNQGATFGTDNVSEAL